MLATMRLNRRPLREHRFVADLKSRLGCSLGVPHRPANKKRFPNRLKLGHKRVASPIFRFLERWMLRPLRLIPGVGTGSVLPSNRNATG